MAFYEATLTLGLITRVTRPTTVGFGETYPEIWINLRMGMSRFLCGIHPLPGWQPDRGVTFVQFAIETNVKKGGPTKNCAWAQNWI